eukprot:7888028-Pyramimonas_sp.AAC.1
MTSRQQQQFNDGPLFVDKEGVVHCNGDPSCGEEFEERAILGYHASEENTKKLYAIRLNNSLNGRAWTLARKKAEISAQAVLDEA